MYTVFFNKESGVLPSDFDSLTEAAEYAEEVIRNGRSSSYQILFVEGETV